MQTKTREADTATETTGNRTIRIVSGKLSEGYKVYNVEIGGLVFPAISKNDAEAFAYALESIIDEHTTDIAAIVVDYRR